MSGPGGLRGGRNLGQEKVKVDGKPLFAERGFASILGGPLSGDKEANPLKIKGNEAGLLTGSPRAGVVILG